MNVREHLLALTDELRRLKGEGGRTVVATDASVEQLRRAVASVRDELAQQSTGDRAPVAVVNAVEAEEAGAKTYSFAPQPQPTRAAPPPPTVAPITAPLPVVALPEGDKQTQMTYLRALVEQNETCRAHLRPGKQLVMGVGSLDADIFFCGEAPGAEEELQGEPFVGPAGQLLTKMIQGMGLQREDVYIGNIMNWRPEMPVGAGGEQIGNRAPTKAEMEFCLPFLRAQLAIVRPKIIVTLGATATAGLLGADSFRALGDVRGRWHEFDAIPLMVTYHPSYILRNQSLRSKRQIWEDLLQVMERAGHPISERQRGFFLS